MIYRYSYQVQVHRASYMVIKDKKRNAICFHQRPPNILRSSLVDIRVIKVQCSMCYSIEFHSASVCERESRFNKISCMNRPVQTYVAH